MSAPTKIFRPEEYKKKVAEYVKKYATEEALREHDQVRYSWQLPSVCNEMFPQEMILKIKTFTIAILKFNSLYSMPFPKPNLGMAGSFVSFAK